MVSDEEAIKNIHTLAVRAVLAVLAADHVGTPRRCASLKTDSFGHHQAHQSIITHGLQSSPVKGSIRSRILHEAVIERPRHSAPVPGDRRHRRGFPRPIDDHDDAPAHRAVEHRGRRLPGLGY